VSQTFVNRYWPGASHVIGRRVRLGDEKEPWTTIVGVAADVRHTALLDPPRPELYRPHAQNGAPIMMLVARGRTAGASAAGALRSAVAQVDRDQPLFRLQSLEALLLNRGAGERATTQVLGFLSVIALVLAAVGTYGVMAYTAAQRVREIGIRLALGASQRDVFSMVLRSGVTLGLLGLIIGVPGAYGVTPLLRAVGAGLDPADGLAYTSVAVLLFGVAVVACVIPAWRATRIDPATVLRNE
jgi:predicted lysophospholipase L1 biosynthesis ABC-type transport system permease subunit